MGDYATDGKCHNAEPGTFGHECGKPAVWIGTKPDGFKSGFCQDCKERGTEAKTFTSWWRISTYRLAPGECATCDANRNDDMMPPHTPSKACENGKHPHCTCDVCY